MIRRPPRSTQSRSSAASDVYKRQMKKLLPDKREQEGLFFKTIWLEALPEAIWDSLLKDDDAVEVLAASAEKIWSRKKAFSSPKVLLFKRSSAHRRWLLSPDGRKVKRRSSAQDSSAQTMFGRDPILSRASSPSRVFCEMLSCRDRLSRGSVSYTHLTLPTIYSV